MKAEQDKVKDSFNRVFSSDDGYKVLKQIKNMCGYNTTSLLRDQDGKIMTDNVLAAEGSRLVWVTLRNYLNDEILKEVEHRR